MDSLSFSSASFEPCAYVNALLRADDCESSLAAGSMKLQLSCAEQLERLEAGMLDFINGVPRALKQLRDAEEGVLQIQSSLDAASEGLGRDPEARSRSQASGIEELNSLDLLKTSMTKSLNTLNEYSRWNELVRETSLFLENGGRLSEVAEKLVLLNILFFIIVLC